MIFITGYQHSGTTILRRIVGAHPDVFEIPTECLPHTRVAEEELAKDNGEHDFSVSKVPVVWWGEDFKRRIEAPDIVRLNIMKNPLDVFSSLILRHRSFTPKSENYGHVLQWAAWARYFLDETPERDFNVKYEDLFIGEEPNHRLLEDIISHCELDRCPDLLERKQREKVPLHCEAVPSYPPSRIKHEQFRSWQVNQPLRNQSGKHRGVLSDEDRDFIMGLEEYQRLYP